MLPNLKNFQKNLQNILLCKWYRLIGRLTFPSKILPRTSYKSQIDIDNLLENLQVYVLRRSDYSLEDTFNELGNLRSDAVIPKQIPFLSLNMLGGHFKTKHAFIRIGKEGSRKWIKNEKVYLSEFVNGYEILNKGCSIYIDANSIHNQSFPYSQPSTSELREEVDKFFKFIPKPTAEKDGFHFQGNVKIVHDPTILNYWHVEYNIFDFKGETIKHKKSKYIEQLCLDILTDIVSVNAYPDVKEITMIPENFYKAS